MTRIHPRVCWTRWRGQEKGLYTRSLKNKQTFITEIYYIYCVRTIVNCTFTCRYMYGVRAVVFSQKQSSAKCVCVRIRIGTHVRVSCRRNASGCVPAWMERLRVVLRDRAETGYSNNTYIYLCIYEGLTMRSNNYYCINNSTRARTYCSGTYTIHLVCNELNILYVHEFFWFWINNETDDRVIHNIIIWVYTRTHYMYTIYNIRGIVQLATL